MSMRTYIRKHTRTHTRTHTHTHTHTHTRTHTHTIMHVHASMLGICTKYVFVVHVCPRLWARVHTHTVHACTHVNGGNSHKIFLCSICTSWSAYHVRRTRTCMDRHDMVILIFSIYVMLYARVEFIALRIHTHTYSYIRIQTRANIHVHVYMHGIK